MQRKWLIGVLALSAVLAACSSDSSDDELACAGVLPIAMDDHGEVRRGGIVTIDVLANDSSSGCGNLRIVSIGDASHGNVAIDNGRLVYMPSRNYIGKDSFSYTIANDEGEATAEVHLDVYESLTLEGQLELHYDVAVTDFTQADVTLSYGDEVTETSVGEAGEYTLSVRVYDVEDLTWGRLDVVLGYSAEGSTSTVRSELHSWLPPHTDLLDSAEAIAAGDGAETYLVDASAQPGLKITAFSSAFYALSQPYTQAFDIETAGELSFADTLSRAALAIDAQLLHDIAVLNASLVDGVVGRNEIRIPNAATDFVGLVNDKPRLMTALEQVQDLDEQPQFSADVLTTADAQRLRGRHLEIGAQLPEWLRAYHYTWQFGANELARIEAAQTPEFATYVTDNENLYFSDLLDSAKLLYADSHSIWFSAIDQDDTPLHFRLVKDSAFALSDEAFDLSLDWVMPTTAGQAMEAMYRFHDDGTFTMSHGGWAGEGAMRSGTWSLNDRRTVLLLKHDDKEVRVQRLVTSGGLPQVLMEDMQSQALRIGPALTVDADAGLVNQLMGKRLLSLFEVRGPEHWRDGELLNTPEIDVTFFNPSQGTMTRRSFSFVFDWQVVNQSGVGEVIEMRSGFDLGAEQRFYWLPLQRENGRLTVLEWGNIHSDRGTIQLLTPPRINIYCEGDACTL